MTIQDQILTLLKQLCDERNMALVLVTHDLTVVRGWTDRVAVMYAGEVVETGPTEAVFNNPAHQYTAALLQSIPRLDLPSHSELAVIDGQPTGAGRPATRVPLRSSLLRCQRSVHECRPRVCSTW